MKNLLNFLLQLLRLRPAMTQTSHEERVCLSRHATGRRRLLEIGVFQGVTTRVLRGAMDKEGRLVGVDPFFKNRLCVCLYEIIARREVKAVKRGSVICIKMRGVPSFRRQATQRARPFRFHSVNGDHPYEGTRSDRKGLQSHLATCAIVMLGLENHSAFGRGGCFRCPHSFSRTGI